ncbi:hypothetical protein Tco_0998879 [Tanacetum coccineum]
MLATGRYAQWRSRFLRYIDTRPNGAALRKCILEGPYTPTTFVVPAVLATENSLAVLEQTTVEIVLNMSPANKAHFKSEKEAIHLILTGIGDKIYSTVNACQTAQEMWEAIKRLQQVNELRAERLAKNANPLALVATAQTLQDPYYQSSKSHKSFAPTSKASLLTRSHATTRHKGKKIAKPITPPSESASDEDSDPEQSQKDKEMQKNLALIAKYFKKIYKPTNNNLRTSSNTRNKNVDTTPRYKNDNQTGQFGNQRAVNVAGARETVGGQLRKVSLQAEQSDWLADTDEEIDEQELEAHYSYMAKIQEVPNADSGTDAEPLEHVQYDTDDNVFANDIQHFEQSESISNTCAVETGDSNVIPDSPDMCDNDIQDDQNDIQKQLKKANATLTQELTECKSILAETSRTLGESNSIRDSCLVALQNKQTEFERYKAFNDRTVDYDKLERKLNETLGLLAQKEIDIKEGLKVKAYEISVVKEKHDELVKQSLLTKSHYEGLVKEKTKVITDLKHKEEKDIDKMISLENQLKFLNAIVYKRSQSIQTIHMLAPKCPTFNGRPTFANPMYLKKAQYEKPCLYAIPHDQSDPANRLVPDREETLTLDNESRSKLNKDLVKPFDYTKLNNLKYVESLEDEINELESDKAKFSNTYDMLLQECVSNDIMCSYLQSSSDLDEITELQCLYLHKVRECDCLAQKLSKQTDFISKEIYTELLRSFAKLEKHSISLEIALQQCQEQLKNDTVCKEKASNVFRKEREQYFEIQDLKAQLQDKNIAIYEIPKPSVLRKPAPFSDSLERTNFAKKTSVSKTNELEGLSKPVALQNLPQTSTQAVRKTNVIKPGMYRIACRVAHRTNVSRPQPRSNQMKDKVLPNTSQVKFKKTEVEDHPRISRISNQTKSVTACNDNLNSRTSNVNAVCATCGKCVFNSNHDACVSKFLNDVNARTKKPNVVPISTRKPKSQANKSVATPHKKTVASESTTTNSKSYYRMLYKRTSKAWKWWIAQQCPSAYT